MKKILKLTLAAAAFLMIGSSATHAQKFGFLDTGELITAMPEMDSVRTKLEAFNKELQDTYELMMVEYNNKMNDYSQNLNTMSDAIRKTKEQELVSIRQRLEEFQESAPQSMQQEQAKLMAPVVEKARNAIQKVGKSNSFTAVFDLASSALAYHDENTMTDILQMVKNELGIK